MNAISNMLRGLLRSPFRGLGGSWLGGIFVILIAGSIASCRSTKKIQKVMAMPARKDTVKVVDTAPPADLKADSMRFISSAMENLGKNHIDFQTFSARVKVHYQGSDGKDYEFNAFIRIKKDSLIWVSVHAALGIEAFRMLITPDSVKILDKLKKIVRLRSVSYLQEAIHLPIDFGTLQDLLIGNPIFLDSSDILFYKKGQEGLSLMSMGSLFKNYVTLNDANNTMLHSKLDDTDPMRARTCDLTYGDYTLVDNKPFSTYRKVSVAEKYKVDIEMIYKQVKFNDPLSINFAIPKNYKRR